MDCLEVQMPVMDNCRPKRARKLSLALSGKADGREQKCDGVKDEKMDGNCEDGGEVGEGQPVPSTPSAAVAASPPRECKGPRTRAAAKGCSPQKQASTARRRKVQEKNCAQENGTNPGSNELTKMAISETFFMPVSKKRKLLAEENKVEASKPVPAEVAPSRAVVNDSSELPVPTLRAKAAVDAKEDAIRSAGKAIHPLFLRAKTSGPKVTATFSEIAFLEPCPPMHVTQYLEDENTETNLRDTCVHPSPLIECCKEEELVHSLRQQGDSLRSDLLMPTSSLSAWKNRGSSSAHSSLRKRSDISQASFSQQGPEDLLVYLKQSIESRRKLVGSYLQPASESTVDESISIEKLSERLSWYKARRDAHLSPDNKEARISHKNMLWTDVYEPKSSKEVCGNTSGVEFLNSWLRSWRERMAGLVNGVDLTQKSAAVSHDESDCDRGWFEDDSDVDTDDDQESGFHSTLLITGPTGCGKTAAIYACAAEQGLTVIEVNASSCRSGASLMQKFGRGGLESQAMGKWSTVEDQEEGDAGRIPPQSIGKAFAKVQGSGKKDRKPRAGRKSGGNSDKCAVGRKVLDSCASSEGNSSVSVEEPQTGSPQKKKKMTVILFEDVDLQFEEDKGFWASLVQLAKKTKRPIILTTNCRQPALPQILEKARIDFCYPSSEELTLHASMISIVEGVACSPWMVNRLVESCRCDMRKLIMSLQFWKQDDYSSPVPRDSEPSDRFEDIVTRFRSEDSCTEPRKRLSLRRPLPDSNHLSSPKCSPLERVGIFSQWDVDARYLYDLDVHHMVLPHVFSSHDPCDLSRDVASRISAAVTELEKHESLVAARDAELEGLAQQAKLDAAEAERRAQRKSKDAKKKGSRLKQKLIHDELAVPRHKKAEAHAAKVSTRSSPLKFKLHRRLLLDNSDNEEEELQADDRNPCPPGESPSSGARMTEVEDAIVADPADVVISKSMEDTDYSVVASCESVAKGRRLRLRQVREVEVLEGSATPPNMEVGYVDATATGVTASEVTALEAPEPRSSSLHILSPSLMPEAVLDENLSDGLHQVTGEQSPEHVTNGKLKTDGESVDLNLKPCSGCDKKGEFVNGNTLSQCIPGEKEFCRSGTVRGSLGDVALSSVTGALGRENTSRLENDVERVPGAEKSGDFVEDSTSRSSFPHFRPLRCNRVFIENESEVVNPVQEAWKALRAGRDPLPHLPLPSRHTTKETDALSVVLDAVSASDTVSSFSSESWKTARTMLSGAWSGAFEGNIGYCSHWEGCQEIASQLVRASLQTSANSSPQTCISNNELPVALGILLAAKDVPAVGKCIINCEVEDGGSIPNLASQLRSTGESCIKEDSIRQSGRYQRLDEIISTQFHLKGRITGASLLDYVAYLALINQRQEEHRAQPVSNSRRSRRFQHHLSSKMSNADIAEIYTLCRFLKA